MTTLQFTPAVALAGGAVLGLAAGTKYLLTGRILGISGAVKGCLTGDWRPWRFAFNGGLLAGAVIAGSITPSAFDVLPASFTVARAALGGLLVGLGSALGNGCTSGQGICGNARMSPRSFVYTLTFMASGAISATLTATATSLGVSATSRAPFVLSPSDAVTHQGALLLATAVLMVGGLVSLAKGATTAARANAVGVLTEAACGLLFAFGLTFTGMVRPAKVAAFLSPTLPCFDATLMFVLGGALLVALPMFQWAKRCQGAPRRPLCGGDYCDPPASAVDRRLLLGGALFGAGWGISGMCPGPALVSLVATLNPSPQVVAYCGAMVLGLAADCAANRQLVGLASLKKAE